MGASLLILLGVSVGLFRIGVQLVPEYRAEVEQRVGSLMNSPVQIGEMDLIWRGRYPTLQLERVVVGANPEERLQLAELHIGFSLLRMLQGDLTPRRVRMRGTALQLSLIDGALQLGGVQADGSVQRPPEDFLDQLRRIGHVQLDDVRLSWIDQDHQRAARQVVISRANVERTYRGLELGGELHVPAETDSEVEFHLVLQQAPWRISTLKAELKNLDIWADLHAFVPRMPLLSGQVKQLSVDSIWHQGQWQEAQVGFELDDFRPAAAPQGFARWRGELQLSALGEGLRAELHSAQLIGQGEAWPVHRTALEWQPGELESGRYALDAQYLRLQDLQPWLALLPAATAESVGAFQTLSGNLHQVVVQSAGAQRWPRITAKLDGVSLAAGEKWPGLQQLSGLLSLDHDGGRIQLDSQGMVVDAPQLFPQALDLDQLSGTLSWQRTASGWQVEAPGLHYAAMSLDGVGRLSLNLGEEPALDLDLNFFCKDPARWLAFQPKFWHPRLKNWLSQAVPASRVTSGQVQIRGDLKDFPFADGQNGVFRVALALEDTTLNFAPDWPVLEMAAADLVLQGNELTVAARGGRIGGVAVAQAEARIADLRDSTVEVEAQLQGDAADIWKMLGQSKLRKNLGEVLDSLAVSGRTAGTLNLKLPLKRLGESDYQARLQFDRAALWTRYWPDPIQKIRGEVQIDNNGLRGRDLTAEVASIPLKINLQPDQGRTRIEAAMSLEPRQLPPSVPVPTWLKQRASGASDWRFTMQVGPGAEPGLRFETNLLGTAWDLPAPLGKQADELRRLHVQVMPGKETRVHVNYAQLLGFDGLLGDKSTGLRAVRIHLGGDALPAGAPGWWIEGQLAQARFDEWLPLIQDLVQEQAGAAGATGASSRQFGGMVLRIGDLLALGQRLPDVRLQMTQDEEQWNIGLAGPRANGSLRIPNQQTGARLQLTGEFERLNWTRAIDPAAGRETQASAPVDPTLIPDLALRVEDLAVNDVPVGRLDLRMSPVALGTRIETLTVDSSTRREIDLSGLWLREAAGISAALDFKVDTQAFRSWLTVLGYQDNLSARRGQLSGRFNWSAHPDGLRYDTLSGQLKFDFSEGRLLNIEPGAGRMLGLFSFNALPRRFFLDFRDVVDTGLGFDSLSGEFLIENGVASSDDLEVKGTSLRIAARGSVDLAHRTYDQTITIYPGLSSGVSLAATVLGGPVVGVFLMFAQELLDKPLDQVTQISYRLGGSWDNPQVSRLQ